ncbi:MAG TPA: ABC transporter substrate-binding protein [Burkholderiales bacterium]
MVALLTLVGVPRAVHGQNVHRVALVLSSSPVATMTGPEPQHPFVRAFVHGLRDSGYREGKNLELQRGSLEGNTDAGTSVYADLVRRKADVLVAGGNPAIAAALRASRTIPIVMINSVDPVGAKLVASLARPGGNLTGLTSDPGPDVAGKQLQLLRDTLPKVRRVAYVGTKVEWDSERGRGTRATARSLGLDLILAEYAIGDYGNAFAVITRERADALITSPHPNHLAHRRALAELALKHKVPSMMTWSRENVEVGGLMSYSADSRDNFRRAAGYVDRILRGAKPADLPVEQPSKFELVINLKTAEALGVAIPTAVLLRADELIRGSCPRPPAGRPRGPELRVAAARHGDDAIAALDARAIVHALRRLPAGGAHAVPLEALGDVQLESRAVHVAAELLELVDVHLEDEVVVGARVDAVAGIEEVPAAAARAAACERERGAREQALDPSGRHLY